MPALDSLLATAHQAATAQDYAGALAALLTAWAQTPAEAIADAIDQVGERARVGIRPVTGKTPKARNAAWHRHAESGDPVMRGVLLASMTETKSNAEMMERLERLVPFRDPRIAAKLGDLIERPLYSANVARTRKFWKRLFELLALVGDPRILARQQSFPASWAANLELNEAERPALASRLVKVLPAILAAYGAGVPTLAAAEAARVAAITAAIDPAPAVDTRAEAALLAEIYAHSDDDAPRLVYADWLQERRDPRGELITLQLARAGGAPGDPKRERALIAEHLEQLIGPLATQVLKSGARFERGFLVGCRAAAGTLEEHPAWATVRELARGLPIADGSALRHLRVATELRDEHIIGLATLTQPLALEVLEWDGPRYFDDNDREFSADGLAAIAVFRKTTVLPKLRRLELHGSRSWSGWPMTPAHLAWAWTSPAGANLEELAIPVGYSRLAGWLAALRTSTLRRLEIVECGEGEWSRSWRFQFERDAAGDFSRLHLVGPAGTSGANGRAELAAVLAMPNTALTSALVTMAPVTFQTATQLRTDLAAAFAKQRRLEAPAVITTR